MNFLSAFLAAAAEHGPRLFVGITVVLAGGCLLCLLHRGGKARRRLGVWTAVAALCYLIAAVVPLPRPFETRAEAGAGLAALPPASRPTVGLDDYRPQGAAAAEPLLPPNARPMTAGAASPVVGPARPATPAAAPSLTEPASSPAATAATPFPWHLAIPATWLGLMVVVLAQQLIGMARLHRILRRCRRAPPHLCDLDQLPARVRVVLTDVPVRPFCTGWLRPIIVLPADLAAPERTTQARAVLRHEAAHLRARDPLVQALFALLLLLLFAHPLFWWLRADVRFQSELLADDRAAGHHRTRYARDLLDLVDATNLAVHPAGTVAVFHRPSAFYRRIQMLLSNKSCSTHSQSPARRAGQLLTMGALVATAAATFGVPATAQDPERTSPRVARLTAERAELQAEIAALRAQITALSTHPDRSLTATGTLPGRLPRAAPAEPLPPGHPTLPHARPPGDESVPIEPAEPELHPPGAGIPPAEVAVGVPLLQDLPLLGEQFRRSAARRATIDATGLLPPPAPTAPATGTDVEATVALVSRLIDLDSELEIAAAEAAALSPEVALDVPAIQRIRADSRVKNLTRKRDIVRQLLKGEIDATKIEMAWLRRRLKGASKTEQLQIEMQIQRAAVRFDALRTAM